MRRLLKRLVKLAILAVLANVALQVARRAMSARQHHEPPIEPAWPAPKVDVPPAAADPEPTPARVPADSAPLVEDPEPALAAEDTSSTTAWVAPDDDGHCPHGYPVKVKVSSGIYHLPGGLAYERTKPDRCYATPQTAEADGYRAAKR